MYEPYGEEKKGFNLREKFNRLKEKILEKTKNINIQNLKFDKISIVAVAFALLLTVGSITSFVSYTGKFKTVQAENEVLKGQNNALQTQLDNSNQQLSTCSSDLESSKADLEVTKGQLTKITLDYNTASTNLQACTDEKLTLASDLNKANEDLKKKQSEYDTLKGNYDDLENNLEDTECNYARDTCNNMKYYFVKDGEVFCCLKDDPEFCTDSPGSAEIKEITC